MPIIHAPPFAQEVGAERACDEDDAEAGEKRKAQLRRDVALRGRETMSMPAGTDQCRAPR